ncbi:hypothetical protein APSETT445_003354 [Aspergillus pseudonomiae]
MRNRAQTDAGFARFLKDHTSPKHQRVTAGGRIVPMEPQTPVPKFKLPVQKKQTSDHEVETLGSLLGIERQSVSGNVSVGPLESNSNRSDVSRNSIGPTGILPDLAKISLTNGVFDQASQGSGCPSTIPWSAPGYVVPSGFPVAFNNQQLPRIDQYPQMAYVPVFPDPTMHSVGSDMYQGLNMQGLMSSIPTSLQPHLAVSTSSSDFASCSNAASAGSSSAFSQGQMNYEPGYPTFAPQVYQFVGSQYPALKQPQHLSETSPGMPHLKCLDEAKMQHESLSAQLSRLDRSIYTSTFSDGSGSTGDEQTSSWMPSPLDLQNLYHKIEEATERGEPVGRLLKELSVVTTQLVKQKREEGRISHRSMRGKQGLPSLPSGKPGSARMTTNGKPVKYEGHRWGSEVHPREAVKSCGDTSSTSDNEANGKLSSSYVSTTDSWATVHERNTRPLSKDKVVLAETHASGAPQNIGWVLGRSEDKQEVKPSNITALHRTHRIRGGDADMQNMKLPISSLNTQLLNRNRGLVFQKTAALAVPQNVNVQAYVPSFDGPGDTPGNETSQQAMETGDRQMQGTVLHSSAQETRPWYIPKQRPKPSREILRDFFRQVRDEERCEMRNSQNEGQSNGR